MVICGCIIALMPNAILKVEGESGGFLSFVASALVVSLSKSSTLTCVFGQCRDARLHSASAGEQGHILIT